MIYPKVFIIILNWNGWEDTLECLESLYQVDYPNYNIIVVDNGSENESLPKIKDYAKGIIQVESDFFKYNNKNKPLKIIEYFKNDLKFTKDPQIEDIPSNQKLILIKNDKNYGFAEGNNIAMRYIIKSLDYDYILLLNNDTVVDKSFLTELVKNAETEENIGAVGPKVYYYDYNGRKDVISFAGEKFNFYISRGKRFATKEIDNGQRDLVDNTDIIEGCCMLLKKEAIEKAGIFDPVYFAYWEETDLCTRIKNEGFKLLYVPNACIWHKVGVSWDTYFSYFVIYHYLVRNRLIFMWKYASKFQKIIFACFFAFYLFFNIVLMLIKEDIYTSKQGLKAIKNGFNDFKSINEQ